MATLKQFQDYFFQLYNKSNKSNVLLPAPEIGVGSNIQKHYNNANIAISKLSKEVTKQILQRLSVNKQKYIQLINLSSANGGDKKLINQYKLELESIIHLIHFVDSNTPKQSEIEDKQEIKNNNLQSYIVGLMQIKGINLRLSNK